MYYGYDIDENLIKLADKVEEKIFKQLVHADKICMLNSAKVLNAFQKNKESQDMDLLMTEERN